MFKLIFGLLVVTAAAAAPVPDRGRIHKDFSLTSFDLNELVADQPRVIREAILARPELFLESVIRILGKPKEFFWLVDKTHRLPEHYKPGDLVTIYPRVPVSKISQQFRRAALNEALAMHRAAKNDGITLIWSSTYRSYAYQKDLFAREVKRLGLETARRESAMPGTSQHQLGTTVDFGSITDSFAFTPEGKWLAAHAGDYGFSLSYPEGHEKLTGYRHECWHYRYITPEGTYLQREFFGNIQQHFLNFWDAHGETLRRLYQPED